MALRVCAALVVAWLTASPLVAQVVRFETSVGSFGMVLNPTNDPRLQAHVDNMLNYVEDNRYRSSWINRADEGFVLQMGGFYSHTKRPPLTIDSTRAVVPFAPVPGEPATTIANLSNTFGTVSLALPGDGFGGTNQDAGTSSFFVNLGGNTFLDQDFTVFAAIPDMTVVNEIMSLMQVDRTLDPTFGAGPGNLAFSDVPLTDNGFQVFIQRAFVVNDSMSVARARAGVESTMAISAATFANGTATPALGSAIAVPEPAALVTTVIGLIGASLLTLTARRRR